MTKIIIQKRALKTIRHFHENNIPLPSFKVMSPMFMHDFVLKKELTTSEARFFCYCFGCSHFGGLFNFDPETIDEKFNQNPILKLKKGDVLNIFKSLELKNTLSIYEFNYENQETKEKKQMVSIILKYWPFEIRPLDNWYMNYCINKAPEPEQEPIIKRKRPRITH